MADFFGLFLFWFFFCMISYVYFGYPALLWVVSSFYKKPVRKKKIEPMVSVIISAFNEEKAIERKLFNLLDLDYPREKLEILIGSDGASDATDEIISRFHSTQIRLFRFVSNFGKPHVLSALAEEAHGEILLFTDARQEFEPDAARVLMANFEDPEVGCVSGELHFKKEASSSAANIGKGMSRYWSYEKFLRKRESEIGSMLGATGAIYAIRKKLFPKFLPSDILVDDMYIPFDIIRKGYRAVFESGACAYDRLSEAGSQEFRRKVRTLTGNYQMFAHFPELFSPFKSPVAWQLISHKFLRLMVPFFLIGLFFSNLLLLNRSFYQLVFLSQVLFYGVALFEAWRSKNKIVKKGIGAIPYTFCLLNYSALIGLTQFLSGRQKAAWEKAYA